MKSRLIIMIEKMDKLIKSQTELKLVLNIITDKDSIKVIIIELKMKC